MFVWVGGGWLESKLSDQLWLSFSLALAKPNNSSKVRVGYKEDADEEGDCREHHADSVNPSPTESVDQKLPNEDWGHLGEGQKAKVDKHVAGKVLNIHWSGNIKVVINTP